VYISLLWLACGLTPLKLYACEEGWFASLRKNPDRQLELPIRHAARSFRGVCRPGPCVTSASDCLDNICVVRHCCTDRFRPVLAFARAAWGRADRGGPTLAGRAIPADAPGKETAVGRGARMEQESSPASISANLQTALINCGMIEFTTQSVCQTGPGPRISW
jgi:hypothetical protein